jgi:HSP90 family molecular chaperone
LDEERRVLTMWDTGVGMNKQEMIDNLGTIARSGSKQFLQENNDNLIADKIIG